MNYDTRAEPRTEFERFLVAIEPMSYDDLVSAMAEIPEDVREKLAQGPRNVRYECGVCQAFGAQWYAKGSTKGGGQSDPADPMWRVFGYHEVPKLDMWHADHMHYGPHANAMYERCIETYRVAGWTGEAAEANA